jgi:hypothetical protein
MFETLKKILKTCFLNPFFIFGILGSCTIAFLIICTYYGNPAWATVAITILLALITAYYALSTDKILHVNEQTLNLIQIERRTAKVQEIAKEFLLPFINQVKRCSDKIENQTNVLFFHSDTPKLRIVVINIYDDTRYNNATDFVHQKFKEIRIDEKYNEPIFQAHIQSIMKNLEKFDLLQKKYELFIKTNSIKIFSNNIFPFIEKISNNNKLDGYSSMYNGFFRSLMQRSPELLRDEMNSFTQPVFSSEYAVLIEDLYTNDTEFQNFVNEKNQYEHQILENIESLSSDLNALLSEWMNLYHITIKS